MEEIKHYESVADAFATSMSLPFRKTIEQYSLATLAGDMSGKSVLDMACGDGYYTRWAKRAGAWSSMGIDISQTMIGRAKAEEARTGLGCVYQHADLASVVLSKPVDLVIAVYSLGYAKSAAQLEQFCAACYNVLCPGGRFVGLNDNLKTPSPAGYSFRKYGFERYSSPAPQEGNTTMYRIFNPDGQSFEVTNFFLKRQTYERAFDAAGFRDFQWTDVSVEPSEQNNPFWDDFMKHPPFIGFTATR